MQLYLIRHAQSQNNALPEGQRVEDPPITEIGHEQARRLAGVLPELELTSLVTSPFLRTLQTTEHLRQTTRLTPYVRPELHERGGCMAGPSVEVMVGRPGLSREQILAQFPGYEIAPEIDGQGWWRSQPYESLELAQLRAQRLLDDTLAQYAHTDARVGYVMHADFKLLFLLLLHREPLDVPHNASLTRLTITPQRIQLDDYNSIAHLPADLITA